MGGMVNPAKFSQMNFVKCEKYEKYLRPVLLNYLVSLANSNIFIDI